MPSLPKPGDPYISGLGRVLEPEQDDDNDGFDRETITAPVANKIVPTNRLSIRDLPADAKTQAVINAILIFQLLGLSDNESAMGLGLSIEEVRQVKAMVAYQETFELIFGELISLNSSSLQARIAAMAGTAIGNVFEMAKSKPDGKRIKDLTVLKANQDILDRSGLSSDALFGRNSAKDDGMSLKIEVTTNDEAKSQKINVNFKR